MSEPKAEYYFVVVQKKWNEERRELLMLASSSAEAIQKALDYVVKNKLSVRYVEAYPLSELTQDNGVYRLVVP